MFLLALLLGGRTGLASPEEQSALRSWATSALLSRPTASAPNPEPPGLYVDHQDYGALTLRRSVMNTPLQVGTQPYAHGLGTHATSEIVVRLPQPAKQFTAQIGVDNNYDTKGTKGSVIFAVEVGGQEVYRSGVCRGGQAPVPVQVDLHGEQDFTLLVLDDGDGFEYDQSDWAEASVLTQEGQRLYLDALPLPETPGTVPPGYSRGLPFSFVYGGKDSRQLLPKWKRVQTDTPAAGGRERHVITYTDPASGLVLRCEATLFPDSPSVDWVLSFRNAGSAETPRLERIRPLDLRVGTAPGNVILHGANGSTASPTDYLPWDRPVEPNARISLAPNGGRSSDGVLPFFNLEWPGGGLTGAIGWSGQWAMQVRRDGAQGLTLQAGQQTARFRLRPGESVRTPRILLVAWRGGDRFHGHNLLRRLLLAHYTPRTPDGQLAVPPVSANTWFTYDQGNRVTEANQLGEIEAMAPLGVEDYWLDAGWFEGGWPSGVGSWVPRADAFPRGLKPLGDAAHRRGLKFILWFEPERVSPGSRIGRDHPEWVLHSGGGDGLFNLGDPAARQWMADLLSHVIGESGVDVFRNDFNIDPLRFWQAADAPDGQGLTEARYVAGLYALWDDLRRRHPGLIIDDCASGGRRIDLETLSRSLPLWRSDSACSGQAQPVGDQVQTAGLSLYVPLQASGVWDFDPYALRSVATSGTVLCMNVQDKSFSADRARRGIAEIKRLRPLYLGDYYPLTDVTSDEKLWCAWQFDRPELGRGLATFFRRSPSAPAELDAALHGLAPTAFYEITFADSALKQTMTGAALMQKLPISIPTAPGSALVTYRKLVKGETAAH